MPRDLRDCSALIRESNLIFTSSCIHLNQPFGSLQVQVLAWFSTDKSENLSVKLRNFTSPFFKGPATDNDIAAPKYARIDTLVTTVTTDDVALHKEDGFSDTSSFVLCEDTKESTKKMLVEQAEALGIQFDHDTSVLMPEQRRALFKTIWLYTWNLSIYDHRITMRANRNAFLFRNPLGQGQ